MPRMLLANTIVQQINPRLVTLFGSVAHDNIGNDLDLLIAVTKHPPEGIYLIPISFL